jgi:hypothetical protein
MTGRHVADSAQWKLNGRRRGDFWFSDSYPGGTIKLLFGCPGCGRLHTIPVAGPNAWHWDGNRDKPTLSPSIKIHQPHEDGDCDWHGYFRGGEWATSEE